MWFWVSRPACWKDYLVLFWHGNEIRGRSGVTRLKGASKRSKPCESCTRGLLNERWDRISSVFKRIFKIDCDDN